MRNLKESEKALRELLAERILVLDGAMGNMLQQRNLTAADFGGRALEGCNENLVLTRPDVVLDIHRKYFEAGSDIQRFTSRYRGKRYSFGYTACPDLEDQTGIWKLLRPEEIVQLTEGFMMDPEASVSALAFHHPDCTYFSVGESEG